MKHNNDIPDSDEEVTRQLITSLILELKQKASEIKGGDETLSILLEEAAEEIEYQNHMSANLRRIIGEKIEEQEDGFVTVPENCDTILMFVHYNDDGEIAHLSLDGQEMDEDVGCNSVS